MASLPQAPPSAAAAPAIRPTPPAIHGVRSRRRPSGEPPPLPRHLNASGKWWLALSGLVLVAWAVVVATRTVAVVDALDTRALFRLSSDRDGQDQQIDVRLEGSCDTTGSTEIRSDREDMQRFERVTMTTPRFEGERYYVFDGGCIVLDFRLSADNRGEPLALATQVVGAVSRADLRDQVHEDSDGRLQLDPPERQG